MLKALLCALLEPTAKLRELEAAGDYTGRMATLEQLKTLPAGAVWDHYCQTQGVLLESDWLSAVREYERNVLSKRT
jgi:L-rhamnose isomerase